jgi:hypothetical protein
MRAPELVWQLRLATGSQLYYIKDAQLNVLLMSSKHQNVRISFSNLPWSLAVTLDFAYRIVSTGEACRVVQKLG